MARVTVEDCVDKVDSPYELVLVAKERATQLNSGIETVLEKDNDKNTVIALREIGDDFESLYKGEISKSGAPILPSKRARKAPEKIQVSKEDLAELSDVAKPDVEVSADDGSTNEQGEISLDEVSEQENQEQQVNSEDPEASNS